MNRQPVTSSRPAPPGRYLVCDVFRTLQGEGANAGRAAVFVRLAGCNLRCPWCDTDYTTGAREVDAAELAAEVAREWRPGALVVLTGGEPGLQVDERMVTAVRRACPGALICAESNGLLPLAHLVDYLVVSPKTAPATLAAQRASEVRYVLAAGDPLPEVPPQLTVGRRYLSPRWGGDPAEVPREALDWCVRLVTANPGWRLSFQQHKVWRVP